MKVFYLFPEWTNKENYKDCRSSIVTWLKEWILLFLNCAKLRISRISPRTFVTRNSDTFCFTPFCVDASGIEGNNLLTNFTSTSHMTFLEVHEILVACQRFVIFVIEIIFGHYECSCAASNRVSPIRKLCISSWFWPSKYN